MYESRALGASHRNGASRHGRAEDIADDLYLLHRFSDVIMYDRVQITMNWGEKEIIIPASDPKHIRKIVEKLKKSNFQNLSKVGVLTKTDVTMRRASKSDAE